MATKDPVHAVWRQHDPAPLWAPQLRRDPHRAEARVTQGKGHDPLLDERGGLVGHPGPAAFSWPQDLRPEPEHLAPPSVERGRVDPHRPTRCPDVAELGGEGQCSQPEPVEGIILGQGGASFPLDCQVKREDASPFPMGVGRRRVSLGLGDRTC
jgi:hypothetical protein